MEDRRRATDPCRLDPRRSRGAWRAFHRAAMTWARSLSTDDTKVARAQPPLLLSTQVNLRPIFIVIHRPAFILEGGSLVAVDSCRR
jgi:hypothetical protein